MKLKSMTARLFHILLLASAIVWARPTLAATNDPAGRPIEGASSPLNAALLASKDNMDDTIKLGPGDVISILIVEDREDARRMLVGDGGDVDIPYIGRVRAVGKTCKALATDAKAILEKDFYHQATVVVGLDSLFKKSLGKVYIIGQVGVPGGQEIPQDETYTVSKAILRAGGFTQFSNKKKVKVIRKIGNDDSKTETFFVDVSAIWEKGRVDEDRPVQAGDLIVVAQKIVNF